MTGKQLPSQPQTGINMPEAEAPKSPRRPEPRAGRIIYDTEPVAGGKRRRDLDVDDEDGTRYRQCPAAPDNGEQGGTIVNSIEEADTTSQYGLVPPNTEAQQDPVVDSTENPSGIVGNDTTQAHETGGNDTVGEGSQTAAKRTRKTRNPVVIVEGEIRYVNGILEIKRNDSWYPAIYHDEYVRHLGPDRLYKPDYTHGRKSGGRTGYDRTAYLLAQRDWGKARANRPAILFEYQKLPNTYPGTNPGDLTCLHRGVTKIVIDRMNNKPLRNFAHIPLTVSTQVEGWLLEAWFRQDPNLQFEDLIQRMPYTKEHEVYKDKKVINRLVRRRELFRDEGRCLSWMKTTWTKRWDKHLMAEMDLTPGHGNSTRHLQDLTVQEKVAIRDATYLSAEHLAKAGKNKLEGAKKDDKVRAAKERAANREAGTLTTTLSEDVDAEFDVEETQGEASTSTLTNPQALHYTNGGQQQLVDTNPLGDGPDLTRHRNGQSVLSEPVNSFLPVGYAGYPGPRVGPQAMRYPVAPANFVFQPIPPSALHTMTDQHYMETRNPHLTKSPASQSFSADGQEHQGNRLGYGYYGVEDDSYTQQLTSQTHSPYSGTRQASSQTSMSTFTGGYLGNGGLPQSSPTDLFTPDDYSFEYLVGQSDLSGQNVRGDGVFNELATPPYVDPRALQSSPPLEPITGFTNGHNAGVDYGSPYQGGYQGVGFGPQGDVNTTGHLAFPATSVGQAPRTGHAMSTHVSHQRGVHPAAPSSIPAGMSRVSSRKRGAEEEPDNAWTGPAPKTRRLK